MANTPPDHPPRQRKYIESSGGTNTELIDGGDADIREITDSLREGVVRVYFFADAAALGLDTDTYKGGIETFREFQSRGELNQWFNDLISAKRFDVIADIRVRDQQNLTGIRHLARNILDHSANEISDGIVLETIAKYGVYKWGRIIAMKKLREKGLAGNKQISKIMRDIEKADGHVQYVDQDIIELAGLTATALENGDIKAVEKVEELEVSKALGVIKDTHRQFADIRDKHGVKELLHFRRHNADSLVVLGLFREILASIDRKETVAIDPKIDPWLWVFLRVFLTIIHKEEREYKIPESFGNASETDEMETVKVLMNIPESTLSNIGDTVWNSYSRGLMDCPIKLDAVILILQNIKRDQKWSYVMRQVARDKPADVVAYVQNLAPNKIIDTFLGAIPLDEDEEVRESR